MKYLLIGMGLLSVMLLSSAYFFAPDKPVATEIQTKTRHISLDGSSFHVEVITIDGVEYIVAKTYRGVGICRK